VIFDLGYFDYGLLFSIQEVSGFYLCRLKSNSSICIKEVVQGLSKKHIGKSLLSIKFKRKRSDNTEIKVEKRHDGNLLTCRVIGFWNPIEELIFKNCKNSLNANQITSNNKNTFKNLLLSSLAT
jgi:hypothetical protein